MGTYEAVLRDVSGQAVIEAAQRFTAGLVPDQSKTFAPSIAEFATEARRLHELIPYRYLPRLPAPEHQRFDDSKRDDPKTRIRMGFKMSVLSAAIALGKADDVAAAKGDLDMLMALAQQWGVPIPEELFKRAA